MRHQQLNIKSSKFKLFASLGAGLATIVAGILAAFTIPFAGATGATASQITNFNNNITAGKKQAYIITVDTTKDTNTTTNKQFTLYARAAGGVNPNYNVYCDIASSSTVTAANQTGNYTCNYSAPGTYTIAVTGTYPYLSVSISSYHSPVNETNAKN